MIDGNMLRVTTFKLNVWLFYFMLNNWIKTSNFLLISFKWHYFLDNFSALSNAIDTHNDIACSNVSERVSNNQECWSTTSSLCYMYSVYLQPT